MSEVLLGLGGTIKEISLRPSKENRKVHVMRSAALLSIYYFTSIVQGISLGLKVACTVWVDYLKK